MATPEARVKDDLKDALDTLPHQGELYVHWPVLNGMGKPEIDCNLVYKGVPYAIECKGPGKKPTDQQWDTLTRKRRAGVVCFVLGGVWGEYRGRPMANADPEDLGLILLSIQDGLNMVHGNWRKHGGTYNG